MSRAKIVVLDGHTLSPGDLSWDELGALGELAVHERTERAEILERAEGAAVLVTNKTPLDAATLGQLPALRGVAVLATGFDVVDVAAARARGVPVCNVPGYSAASVAEHALALLLELTHRVGMHAALVREGAWARSVDFTFWNEPLAELAGQRLGIVGFGAVGQRVARAALALGLDVVATPSRRVPEPPEGVRYAAPDALFAESDVVSLHCPLTPETQKLVDWRRLLTMKPTALLVNTARGGLIDEPALARALAEGVIAGAGLDVLSTEPPPADHELLRSPRCIVTPHQAWTTLSARRRLLAATVANVKGLIFGRPVNVVNP